MSIIQISKIQQRSGNLVDLPQLDEAEFGWATDAKRLFIGKITPNENIEILTSYSEINFSQINGSVGNLNITALSVADGQVLAYDGTNWVNRGGDAGGLITLGDVSNVKITGGAIGYVLETDGTGNLSWTPKSTIITYIENVTQANPAVVTTVQDNFLTDGLEITITDAAGMTQLNGNTYYVDVLTANTFALYSDSALTTPIDSSLYNEYAYTSVTATTASTNVIDVGNAALMTLDAPVRFLGSMSTSGIVNDFTYYVKTRDTIANTITVSNELLPNGVAGNTVSLQTTAGLTANVYQEGGRAIASITSGTGTAAGGANTSVQFNNNNLLDGDADLTYDFGASPKLLTLNGNANVGNLNGTGIVTATRFISNIATGTTPIQVNSTTRVGNLNVAYANVSDFEVVTAQTTGTFYPVFVNGSSTANYALGANSALAFNVATGNLSMSLLNVTGNANVGGNLGVAGALAVVGNISGANISTTGSLSVTGNANVGNIGSASGIFTANVNANNLNSSNAANIGTTLDIGGVATFAANANVTGNLNVTANVNVATRLNVTSVATFSANANVAGNVNVTANVLAGNVLSNGTVGGNTATLFGTILTTGANINLGTITGNWTLSTGSRLQATYADLAEYYESDVVYAPGTVVEFGGEKEVTLASNESTKVAGVVSTNPAYVMNATCPGIQTPVALQGRVPCKVKGTINKGDLIVSAGDGFAKAANTEPKMGSVLGKSLTNFDGIEGVIEVAVGRL